MAIDTNDKLVTAIAGQNTRTFMKNALAGTLVVGRPYGLLGTAGNPGVFTVPTTLAGANTDGTTLAGALPYSNAAPGNTDYISKYAGSSSLAGSLKFYDMLWWNGGINATLTTAQTINSAAFPSRDANGTVNGIGCSLWIYVSAVLGAAAPTITVSYTNSAGTAGRTGTQSSISGAIAGTMIPLTLQAGDTGVQSVQSVTLSVSQVSGTMHLMLLKPLSGLDLPLAGLGASKNFYDLGMKVQDGTCIIGQWTPTTTGGAQIISEVSFIEG
jgi:hypothetical protein